MKPELAIPAQQAAIFEIYRACRADLEGQGIFQWYDKYPTPELILEDINLGHVYGINVDGNPIAAISLSTAQEVEYAAVDWQDKTENVMVVHRLAVLPQHQRKGLATILMDFAEEQGLALGHSSIRLDAYSGNERVLQFYTNRGYQKRGEFYFKGRELAFWAFEKILI